MENRKNEFLTEFVKQSILFSRNSGDKSAILNLQKTGISKDVIKRLLFTPDKIRSSDLEGQQKSFKEKLICDDADEAKLLDIDSFNNFNLKSSF